MQGFQPVGTRYIREPVFVLLGRRLTNTFDILEHGKPQGIRVYPAIPRAVVGRLKYHIGMAMQKLQHKPFGDFTFIIKVVQDGVMPESGPALVHHLCLFLRIKILADLAYNAQHFALPGLQQRGILLHEVQQVLLWLRGITAGFRHGFLFLFLRQCAPQHIHLALQILFTAFLTGFLFL